MINEAYIDILRTAAEAGYMFNQNILMSSGNYLIDGDNGSDPRSPYYTGRDQDYEEPATVYGYDNDKLCPGNHEDDEQVCDECLENLRNSK